ncbi:hypothetical protein NUW54_g234 [Trametes sanguinea]|uniref:Uncharacterized protein n=1 Tax=Trametes sanguinea TaxID=158606 RepID=A0ACC1QAB5_9APHY|nr:hypothetical protein NUW54_g234 [Trametes sanguinea]
MKCSAPRSELSDLILAVGGVSGNYISAICATYTGSSHTLATDIHTSVIKSTQYALKQENRRIKWLLQASLIPLARRGLIYETGSARPRLVLLSSREDWDPACGAFASTEDLDTDVWFRDSDRFAIVPVTYFPGTECWLRNGFDIVALRPLGDSDPVPLNTAIRRLFSMDWHGNLLVIKRGRYDSGRAISITPPEISLINAVVQRWLEIRSADPSSSDDDL